MTTVRRVALTTADASTGAPFPTSQTPKPWTRVRRGYAVKARRPACIGAHVGLALVLASGASAQTVLAGFSERSAAAALDGPRVVVAPEYRPREDSYGTATQSVSTVSIMDFMPPITGNIVDTTWSTDADGYLWQTAIGSGHAWMARVDLPSGAIVDRVELNACDTSIDTEIVFGMMSRAVPGGTAVNLVPVATTGGTATPGCALFSVTPTSTVTVDNRNNDYMLGVILQNDPFAQSRAGSFRVFYRLQVSPAPATATFTDVSVGHPFHRFVEALFAAGITGGCTATTYCPDAAVTRGQMAVFLSVALGLHWPH